MGYTGVVAITGFRHKGLERFFVTGAKGGVQAKHVDRLRLILGRLNVAVVPKDMDLPGLEPMNYAARGRAHGPSI